MFSTSEYSTARLVYQTVGFLLFAAIGVYILHRSEKESIRLLNLSKKSYPDKKREDDVKELKRIRRRLVIGYVFFVALSILAAVFYGLALLDRM